MDALRSPDILQFGPFRFDRRGRLLFRCAEDGRYQPVSLGSRALTVLAALTERPSDLATKDEIMRAVWPGTVVEESNLTVQISALRRILDARSAGESCIQTVSGRGYRFVLPVTCLGEQSPVGEPPPPDNNPPAEPAPAKGDNLPRLANALIGRERDAAEIEALLSRHRLVTLVGAPGVGKTSLALQVGANLLARFPDGARFVELAALNRDELVSEAVTAAFGLPVQWQRSAIDAIAAFLRSRRVLLILDNCEHVIAAVARLADTLLKTCPGVVLLTTSREALSVAGEHAYPVPLLDVPPGTTSLTAAPRRWSTAPYSSSSSAGLRHLGASR